MPTPTDDNRELLTVIARMRAEPGKEAELRRELESLIDATLAEDGCVNYDLHVGDDDPGVFYFYENWESPAKLDAHLAAPHLVEFGGKVGDLLDEDGLTIQRLRRIG